MYELISKVANQLIQLPGVDSALLSDIAELISEEDYRAHFLEEVASHLLRNARLREAETLVDQVSGLERSRVLCGLARTASEAGHLEYADKLFSQALEATEVNRFPTEKGIAVLEVAQALQRCGRNSQAVPVFSKAIEVAAPGQMQGGTAGPEASGVILSSVQALQELGEPLLARAKAELITVPSLRERAYQILE